MDKEVLVIIDGKESTMSHRAAVAKGMECYDDIWYLDRDFVETTDEGRIPIYLAERWGYREWNDGIWYGEFVNINEDGGNTEAPREVAQHSGDYVMTNDYGYYYVEDVSYIADRGYYQPTWYADENCSHVSGEWYEDPVSDLAEYHSRTSPFMDDDAEWRMGYECEKEDTYVLDDYSDDDCSYYGFRKESDGSLGSDGFEFISPVYNLFGEKVFNDMDKSIVACHINADYGDNCGGHMTVSHKLKTGEETYDYFENYIPLLMALYPDRLDNSYSSAHVSRVMKYNRSRLAVHLRGSAVGNGVEFRIFPAIENVTSLKWRIELLRYMAKNPDTVVGIANKMRDKRTKLHALLAQRRCDVADLMITMLAMADRFFETEITYPHVNKSQKESKRGMTRRICV